MNEPNPIEALKKAAEEAANREEEASAAYGALYQEVLKDPDAQGEKRLRAAAKAVGDATTRSREAARAYETATHPERVAAKEFAEAARAYLDYHVIPAQFFDREAFWAREGEGFTAFEAAFEAWRRAREELRAGRPDADPLTTRDGSTTQGRD